VPGVSRRPVRRPLRGTTSAPRQGAGTAALGGPRFLSEENVRRIYTRPDEKYRERGITGRG